MVVLTDIIGLTGAVLILVAYVFLLLKKIFADDLSYSLLNFLGALLILFSLLYAWNIAAVAIELAWLGVSFYGLVRWGMRNCKR